MEYARQNAPKRPVGERLNDHAEVEQLLGEQELIPQAARCMNCGIPFCHMSGCPVENLIPDFNDMVYRGQWRHALELLHSTNNFPEVTGRVCPAPCETACTLAIIEPAVTIRQIELQIVERGWDEGWIQPEPAAVKSGFRVAVVGSGPAGLAAAQQLARAGHEVTVFEADDRIGGILRYGIPDFKLEKRVLDRRLEQMRGEGVRFETRARIGADISMAYLRRSFDAVLLAGGARVPRDLPVPGRELDGVHFAMTFLTQQNRRNAGDPIPDTEAISAAGKHVVIIGGGDTGSDCLGTSLRQGAQRVTQVEILPRPPDERDPSTPWPLWPYQLRTSTSHQEGGERMWNILTRRFLDNGNGAVAGLEAVRVEWGRDEKTGRMTFSEVADSVFELRADLVLLAMGFTREGNAEVLEGFGIEVGPDLNAVVDANGMTSLDGVFVAGDLFAGASLVVRAIADGRLAAERVSRFLAGGA
jgi:NAD(P)H-dependent glutamate synthase small subunit